MVIWNQGAPKIANGSMKQPKIVKWSKEQDKLSGGKRNTCN